MPTPDGEVTLDAENFSLKTEGREEKHTIEELREFLEYEDRKTKMEPKSQMLKGKYLKSATMLLLGK